MYDLSFWNNRETDSIKEREGERVRERYKNMSEIKNQPIEDPEEARRRFILELEFVQCLANPEYLNCKLFLFFGFFFFVLVWKG